MIIEVDREELAARASAFVKMPVKLHGQEKDKELLYDFEITGTIEWYGVTTNVSLFFGKDDMMPISWWITDRDCFRPMHSIGRITLGAKVVVSDPGYSRSDDAAEFLCNVRPGQWNVYACIEDMGSPGPRLQALELVHTKVDKEELDNQEWVEMLSFGIDSGAMCIIDDQFYRRKDGSSDDFEADEVLVEAFHLKCYELVCHHVGLFRVGGKAVGVVGESSDFATRPVYAKELGSEIVALREIF